MKDAIDRTSEPLATDDMTFNGKREDLKVWNDVGTYRWWQVRKRSRAKMQRVLAQFKVGEWHYAYDAGKKAGFRPGMIYPHLAKLEALGLLESRWEVGKDRNRRRQYRRTA